MNILTVAYTLINALAGENCFLWMIYNLSMSGLEM